MEFAQQFFTDLDDPASLAFFGLLAGAFLIGLLPSGLSNVSRSRDAKRKLAKHIAAHQRTAQERNVLEGQLEREREKSRENAERLKRLMSDRSAMAAELTQLRASLDGAHSETLAAQIARKENDDYVAGLRGKVAALSAQVQALKAAASPKAAPTGFDLDLIASNKSLRTKAESLEERVASLMEDNEKLRRQLTT